MVGTARCVNGAVAAMNVVGGSKQGGIVESRSGENRTRKVKRGKRRKKVLPKVGIEN